ncbi:hypothetical protein JCM25156A_05430 [Komagataeibacter kakiaceti JCM 25156]
MLLVGLSCVLPVRLPRQVACIRAGWGVVGLLVVILSCGGGLPGGVARWPGFFAPSGDVALLVPLALVGLVATDPRNLVACAGAALAVMGGPVLSCMGAGWVLLAGAGARPARQAPDMIGLLLLAGALACPGRSANLLPGLCWIATRGLLGLSFSPRVAVRALCPFRAGDIAGLVAGMAVWTHLLADERVADIRWGGLLIGAGCVLYGTAAWRSLCAMDVRRVMSGLMAGTGALVVVIAGLMVLARADDLPGMAICASRTLLLVAGSLPVWVFMARAMAVMEHEAGPLVLGRLGGLGMLMPRLSGVFALGLLAESGLPPLLGFSIIWMLAHLLAAMPHAGGLAGDLPLLLALGALGAGWAIRMLALVRIVAVMLCGRPRTPRCAGARDPRSREMAGVMLASLPFVLVSIWPGYWLGLLENAAPRMAAGPWPGIRAIMLAAPDGAAVLHPARLCLLVAGTGAMVAVLRRILRPRPARQVASWQQGAPAVPPWMVFGDPLTQVGPGNPPRMVLDMMMAAPRRLRLARAQARMLRRWGREGQALVRRGVAAWRGHAVSAPVAVMVACVGALMFIAWCG